MSDIDSTISSTTPSTRTYNRYTKIHGLFRELAKAKILAPSGSAQDLSTAAIKIKRFWKDFFGIDSLMYLSDKDLSNLEHFIEERIKSEEKKHD